MSFEEIGAPGLGVDIVEVSRFENLDKDSPFIKKIFFESEREYCFSYNNQSVHLAGMFAAKEAVSKALGVASFPFSEIEIRHKKDGAPEAWKDGIVLPVKISIAHTDKVATAIAVG